MNKNMNSNQLVLIAIAGVLLLLAAFSFMLLQDPSAPLPFSFSPATSTLAPPTQSGIAVASSTPLPTRQTSYTPFATLLSPPPSTPGPGTLAPTPSQGITPGASTPTLPPTRSSTPAGTRTPSSTITATTPSVTSSPAITNTLSPGEVGVTGRVLQNGTPVANVNVVFEDDISPRTSATNQNGSYWFVTLAPGTAFSFTFNQADNPLLTPAADIASTASLNGTLPTNTNPIHLPDFEVSLHLNGVLFELDSPADGTTFSASAISSSTKLQFIWTLYNLGGSYHIELGPQGSNLPIWTSSQIASTDYFWDGTLGNGTHITQGTYWWRVAVTRTAGNYVQVIFTQPLDIIFTP